MGGQAFSEVKSDAPIIVPRMPLELYQRVAADVRSKLETIFHRVTIPREAPGKLDYGDVDFLVEGQRITDTNIWHSIASLLGAELHVSRGGSHSFGIRHPETPEAYVQVDVEISPRSGTLDGAELFEWTRFMKGDSDLLQIIGVCHRPLGITCNDRGLHIRVEEVEPYNKKQSLLFLTRHPNEALQFYGLDTSKYWTGFKDERDLFDWVSKGRFFSRAVFDARTEKSNDRSRQSKRPMYRRFVEEYMSTLSDAEESESWSRREVLEEALKTFGKRGQYNKIMEEHNQKEAEDALWRSIRDLLPVEGRSLGTAVKGLRHWVDFKDGNPCITARPLATTPVWTAEVPPGRIQHVLDWVAVNWQEVKSREKTRGREAKEVAINHGGT